MRQPWKALACITISLTFTTAGVSAEPSHLPVHRLYNVQRQHPEMASQLLQRLREKYPDLGSRLWRASMRVQAQHPGIVFDLPRHVVEEAPLESFEDVAFRVVEKRPESFLKLARSPQLKGARDLLRTRYPQLVADVAAHGLTAALSQHRPQLREIAASLLQRHEPQALGEFIHSHLYLVPHLLKSTWVRQAVADIDPQAAVKVLEIVHQHYPGLGSEVQAAVEAEAPGFTREVESFLAGY